MNELIGEDAVLLIHSRQLKDTIFTSLHSHSVVLKGSENSFSDP